MPLRRACAAADARWAAPVMPGLPATTRTARDHLWAVGGRGRHHRATSSASTSVGAGRGDVEADVGDLDVAGQRRARRRTAGPA